MTDEPINIPLEPNQPVVICTEGRSATATWMESVVPNPDHEEAKPLSECAACAQAAGCKEFSLVTAALKERKC
jgi:hypothetical protein